MPFLFSFHFWSFWLPPLLFLPFHKVSADKWVTQKICQIWEKKCLNFSESGAGRALTKFNTSQPARVPKSWRISAWVPEIVVGFRLRIHSSFLPILQLLTPDSLISEGKCNSLFRKISCILVNWGVRERKVKKRVTMSRFQISCILVKWGGAREKGGRVTMSRWGRR